MASVWGFDAGSSSVMVGMRAGLEQDDSVSVHGPRVDWWWGKEVYYTRSQINYWRYVLKLLGFNKTSLGLLFVFCSFS